MKTIYAMAGCSIVLFGLIITSSFVALEIAKQSAVQATQLQELRDQNTSLGGIVKAQAEKAHATTTTLQSHRSR